MITSIYYLENKIGQRRAFIPGGDYHLINVKGLGVNNGNEYTSIGDGFFQLSKEDDPQGNIVADVVFMTDAFENYQSLVKWIAAAEELYFVYVPFGTTEYYRTVRLQYFEKSRRINGRMTSSIALESLSPWYLPTALPLTFDSSKEDSFRVNVSRIGAGKLSASFTGNYEVTITPDGMYPAGLYVEIDGVATNPVIALYGITSGKLYGRCAVTDTIQNGEKLILSTATNDSFIVKRRGNDETSLLDSIDILDNPFFKAPVNEPTTLSITDDGGMNGTASAKVFYYFRSV